MKTARLLTFWVVGVGVCCGPTPTDLLASEPKSQLTRVGGPGLTFLLPPDFSHCEGETEEGQVYVWKEQGATVTYSRSSHREWKLIEPIGKSFCPAEMRQKNTKVSFSNKPSFSVGFAIKAPESVGADYVTISGPDASKVCQLAGLVLPSIQPTNTLEGIRVVYISPDQKYFVVKNEVGQFKAATLGDFVTRNGGKVLKIERRSATVLELQYDPETRRYSEVSRQLVWRE